MMPTEKSPPNGMASPCELFLERHRAYCAGESSVDPSTEPHLQSCPACAELVALDRLFDRNPPPAKPSRQREILAAVVADLPRYARERRLRQIRFVAVASLLIAVSVLGVWRPWGDPSSNVEAERSPDRDVAVAPVSPSAPEPTTPAAPSLRTAFADGELALRVVTKKAGDAAGDAAETLLPAPMAVGAEKPDQAKVVGAIVSLQRLGDGAKRGLTPLTDTTQRAFRLLRRDAAPQAQ